MSAIAGLVYKNGKPVAAGDLARMDQALAAHGEGSRVWQNGVAGLLQRQAIITPEDCLERQPLVSDGLPRALVSAARLDNRAELAQELGLHAGEAHTVPTSTLLWQAYQRWGDGCLHHLAGDYTLAAWNEKSQRLLLAGSPFSSQPLYYFDSPSVFAFASMPKGLFALKEVPRRLDEEYVAKSLARVPRLPGFTFYQGIRQLLPGQTAAVQDGHLVIRDFWEWDPQDELRLASDAEYEEAFLALYTRVASDHLRSISPVGIMLSGGLDSASLAAVAAPLLGAKNHRMKAYTEAPRPGFTLPPTAGRYADEMLRVKSIAGLYDNLDTHFLRSSGTHFLQDAGTYLHHAEVPFRNACNRPWIEAIFRQAQAHGVRVLLMGSQGNGTVSWKGETDREKAGKHPLRQLAAQIKRQALDVLAPPRPSLLHPDRVKCYGIQRAQKEALMRPNALGSTAQRSQMIRNSLAHGSSLWAGYGAMFGIEVRDPTADPRIVRFCLSLPPEQSCRGGETRRLIRRTMAGRLPEEILSGRRRGLQAADWRLTLVESQCELQTEFDRISQCALAGQLMHLPGLRRSLNELACAGRGGDPLDIGLRNHLEQGLMTGRFLSWFETGQ